VAVWKLGIPVDRQAWLSRAMKSKTDF